MMKSSSRECFQKVDRNDDSSSMDSSGESSALNTTDPPVVVAEEPPKEHSQRRSKRPSVISAFLIPAKTDYDDDATSAPSRPMDLEREKTKMESFDCYILVSVLTATSSFCTLQSFEPLNDVQGGWIDQTLLVLTLISAGLSTICGLYATVVFSLTVLYAKSAIGMNRDHTYQYFMAQTAAVRVRGFRAFSASLLSFALEAGLVTFLRIPAIARLPVLVGVVALLHFICSDWQHIVETATVIYAGKIPSSDPVPEKKIV